MRLSYIKLFSVGNTHTFYSNRASTDLEFVPTPETAQLMERYKLRMRTLPTGFEVYYEADETNAPLAGDISNALFRFGIRAKNVRFHTVTDLSSIEPLANREILFFEGIRTGTSVIVNPSSVLLHPMLSEYTHPITASAATAHTVEVGRVSGAMNEILNTSVAAVANATEISFTMDARSMNPLVSDYALNIENPVIGAFVDELPMRFDQFMIDEGFTGMLEISQPVTNAVSGTGYNLTFTPASATWTYYIVKTGAAISGMSVVDPGASSNFSNTTVSPEKQAELLSGLPAGSGVQGIASTAPISYTEASRQLQLLDSGSSVVKEHLPNVNSSSHLPEVVVYL
ncbi:MAG: hypothetical protein ACFB10_21340 [Salibacteraceae bacterium]